MRVVMALTALLLMAVFVVAQAETVCVGLQDDVRRTSVQVDLLSTSFKNQALATNQRFDSLDAQNSKLKAELYQNQDTNALQLRNDIYKYIDERTDPVRTVMPFIFGFGFCFFLFAALMIKTNMFMLRKMRMIDVESD